VSESGKTVPLLETDAEGWVVRSLGAAVPRHAVYAALAGNTLIAPAGAVERAVSGLYDYARKMRDQDGDGDQSDT